MSVDEIKRLTEARPFQPFRIRVADAGEPFEVPHPDYVSIGPDGRRVIVVWHSDGTCSVVNPSLITRLEVLGMAS